MNKSIKGRSKGKVATRIWSAVSASCARGRKMNHFCLWWISSHTPESAFVGTLYSWIIDVQLFIFFVFLASSENVALFYSSYYYNFLFLFLIIPILSARLAHGESSRLQRRKALSESLLTTAFVSARYVKMCIIRSRSVMSYSDERKIEILVWEGKPLN